MLKRLWAAWKRFAQRVGNFQARVLLTVLYGALVLPFGLAVRWLADPLRIKRPPDKWIDRSEEATDMNWARRQW